MPKLQVISNNWTAGEFSPRLKGRSDIQQFNASADLLRNVVVLRHGGVTLRPPLDFVGEVDDSNRTCRPLPFVYSRAAAYVLVFGHQTLEFIKNGAYIESSPGVRYQIATPYTEDQLAEIDWTHAADTMILMHGSVKTRRLRRFSDTLWVLDEAPFSPAAMAETGHRAAVTMTISNVAVGSGRTLTAGAAFFCDADVGRRISWGGGEALLTAVGGATSATATVTAAFGSASAAANSWLLDDSPMASLTVSAKDPVGAAVTLTLASAGWRVADIGKHVEVNNGLVKITGGVASDNDATASGVIVNELASTTAAPADAWVLKGDAWNAVDGYPETGSFHEQRLWMASTARFPQTVFGSRSGLYLDFTPGTADDSAVSKTAASDQVNPINFLCSTASLLAMGYEGEFESRGGVEKPITQSNMQIKLQSEWGSEPNVRPETVGKTVLYAERGGKALRTFGPQPVDGFDGTDISVFSEHLLRAGIKFLTYERRPESVAWVGTRDGKFAAFTISEEQNVKAWASCECAGAVEWAVTIPEEGRDSTYVLVRRTIDGVTRRYMERLNWDAEQGWHDSRVYQTAGVAQTTWGGFDHLVGETVRAHADGIHVGTFTVNASGEITLPRAALTLSAGLPYDAKIIARAPEVGTGTGTSQGQAMSTHNIKVRVLESIGMRCNGDDLPVGSFGPSLLDQAPQPFSGILEVTNYGWDDGESPVVLEQVWGYPWTVLALIRDFTVNQG